MDRIAAMLFWKYATLEDYETTLMKEHIKPGMKVLDIGANIGYHTLQISKWVGKEGHVTAFEPDPENYRLLQKNIDVNLCANVTVFQGAVSNLKGELKLYFCEENRGDHRIFDSGDQRTSFTVQSIKLDEFFKTDERYDVIKMDIQGAEPLAFEGMKSFLSRHKSLVIFCEFFPDVFTHYRSKPIEFLKLIEEHGFKISVINDHERTIGQCKNEEIIEMCRGERYVNLLLVKS
ncbi:MAG: FkbM family methyltransferase [Candidatus Omnitrophota bacterium]